MRGSDPKQDGMFSYVSAEQRVPAEHPLRPLRTMVDDILKEMSPRFAKLYADTGRPSIPPERLLRALLLQILYTVRSERLGRSGVEPRGIQQEPGAATERRGGRSLFSAGAGTSQAVSVG